MVKHKKRSDAWLTIPFKIGDRVRLKINHEIRGLVTHIDHTSIFEDGFVRLDRIGYKVQVRLVNESLEGETPIFNSEAVEYDPLYQLAKEAPEA
jgi:hypothetical protein